MQLAVAYPVGLLSLLSLCILGLNAEILAPWKIDKPVCLRKPDDLSSGGQRKRKNKTAELGLTAN